MAPRQSGRRCVLETDATWRSRRWPLVVAILAFGTVILAFSVPTTIAGGLQNLAQVGSPVLGPEHELSAPQADPESPESVPELGQSEEPGFWTPDYAAAPSSAVIAGGASLSRAYASVSAPSTTALPFTSRLSSVDGRFLLLNMHGVLFHSELRDLEEEIAYARWMNAGAMRVFATDNNTLKDWSGKTVGNRIADIAPTLRAANVKLVVALVNNHRPVPGEPPDSFGSMDGFNQLLLPFYTTNWPKAYLPFVRDLITTVQARGAGDVILAWELGNELHATMDPAALIPFVMGITAEIQKIDPKTPILPGTIGVEHMNPGNPHSPLGRWLYCDAPVDAYTLHSYDWVGPNRQGISSISYDFDEVLSQPCSNGRRLPVLMEELGTSRSLEGVYSASEEEKRLQQELSQIRYVVSHPEVIGIGAWNAESPKVRDRVYYDNQRGLTSYGPAADGFGSCYDGTNGIRCRLEQALRNLPVLP
jgi:hypothetical protein